jgi:hypothetical protein
MARHRLPWRLFKDALVLSVAVQLGLAGLLAASIDHFSFSDDLLVRPQVLVRMLRAAGVARQPVRTVAYGSRRACLKTLTRW